MVTRDVLKVLKFALAYCSCNFENFQNITRVHKSRNALAFIRFPILKSQDLGYKAAKRRSAFQTGAKIYLNEKNILGLGAL